ncbi:Complex I intermediate-associated protein 30 (CIA30) [Sulfitobacter sp. THAF37]|uniref:CIA30 family protein n=1 Tax=Sulfitobacter sp. THAF37 TaxID=2587855 RepID=UPI001268A1C2|nr:CIA30 family protein [Sulfitobacter sp. THAF37]QFT57332.1 Complex I intermediate-associated protein 30 (CIA30) [Sulfitobacter sp. THAF37]
MQLNPDWEFVADTVMGGVSTGHARREPVAGRDAMRLTGDVSLENDGGFVQMAFDLQPDGGGFDASGWNAIALEVRGNGGAYDLRLRTEDLTRPWQSFRSAFVAEPDWRTLTFPFSGFEPHRTDARFDPARLRRIGVLGIGRVFHAEVAVGTVRLVNV